MKNTIKKGLSLLLAALVLLAGLPLTAIALEGTYTINNTLTVSV
jgi:hypothetical protein